MAISFALTHRSTPLLCSTTPSHINKYTPVYPYSVTKIFQLTSIMIQQIPGIVGSHKMSVHSSWSFPSMGTMNFMSLFLSVHDFLVHRLIFMNISIQDYIWLKKEDSAKSRVRRSNSVCSFNPISFLTYSWSTPFEFSLRCVYRFPERPCIVGCR